MDLAPIIEKLHTKKILVSLFIDANVLQIKAAKDVGADIIEIHTGEFCKIYDDKKNYLQEFDKIKECAKMASDLGLECHAGHGLNYETAKIIAQIAEIKELNIGHFIIGEAVFEGLEAVIKKMKKSIQ